MTSAQPPGDAGVADSYRRVIEAGTEDRPLRELLSLAGSVAIVTGGGGVGLGQACCDRLAELGAAVHVNDIDGDRARAVAESVASRHGVATSWSACDAGDYSQVVAAVAVATRQLGPVDVLVNTVGGGIREPAAFVDDDPERFPAIVARNLLAPLNFTHAVLTGMFALGRGSIVNISSEAAEIVDTPIVYGSCKSGVDSFTNNLAHQLADSGIRVNSVRPGYLATTESERVLRDDGDSRLAHRLRTAMGRTAMGRPGHPREIADVVAFLASPAASYVQGATVRVSGGLS